MVQLKHYNGISERLKRDKTGPSDALRRIARRPDGNYHHNAVVNNIQYDRCDKCNNISEFKSRINGELEYSLCKECYRKRNEKTTKRKL